MNILEKYNVEIIRSNRKSLALEVKPGPRVIVRAPMRMPKAFITAFLYREERWILQKLAFLQQQQQTRQAPDSRALSEEQLKELKKLAKKVIPEKLEKYAEIMGVKYNKVSFRCQKTRWGSCGSNGNLNFNILLMLTPEEVIDSVVCHELCHLKHMNHSKAFYDELYRVYPNYKQCQKWLKDNGSAIMARAHG